MKRTLILIVATVAVFCNGCVEGLRNKQLEKVAKDWSLVIRASQILPVYPLTEDLQPGDVFLVNTPIEEQVAIYKEKGFLPLDQFLVRLYSKDLIKEHSTSKTYMDFYNDRYKTDQRNEQSGSVDFPPAQWQNATGSNVHQWSVAPGAAFPSYQFSVRKGAGINLAIPIHGVPFSLDIMKTGRASGTVTIADAKTFGLDNTRLLPLVTSWVEKNQDLLRRHAPTAGRQQYLRVVSRVYVTGRVNVTVNNAEETNGQAGTGAGANRPVALLSSSDEYNPAQLTEEYNKILRPPSEGDNTQESTEKTLSAKYNQILGDANSRLRVHFTAASRRSVSLIETFARPLVIGYIGFDVPIQEAQNDPSISPQDRVTGQKIQIGAPISTRDRVTGQKIQSGAPISTRDRVTGQKIQIGAPISTRARVTGKE